jgi:hypothetical protein
MAATITRLIALLPAVWSAVPVAAAAQGNDQTFQQASIDFIQTYFEKWSASNAVALSFVDEVFPDHIVYFNKTLTHAALMDAKRRFVERWPERRFVARPDTLKVTCDAQHFCTVWGLVDWTCRSPQRRDYATGTSQFSLQLQDGQAVVSENGFVVSRGHEMPRNPPQVVAGAGNAQPPAEARAAQPHPPVPEPVPESVPDKPADQPVNYTNTDIPALRSAYLAQMSDSNWIVDWLMAQKRFAGTARSLGPSGEHTVRDDSGAELHLMLFEADQGPIACLVPDRMPAFPQGATVNIQGIISVFIDKTMYLARCTFA